MSARPLVVVYGISNCDTVRRARAWLDEHGLDHRFHDFAKAGVPPDRLDAWLGAVGWEALLNRRGTTWRKLDDVAKAAVVDPPSAARSIAAQPSLVKRPVAEWPDGAVSVGFDAAAWAARR